MESRASGGSPNGLAVFPEDATRHDGPDAHEPDSDPAQANPIAPGQCQAHGIDAAQDPDWLSFELAEPSRVVARSDVRSTQLDLFGRPQQLTATTADTRLGTPGMRAMQLDTLGQSQQPIATSGYTQNAVILRTGSDTNALPAGPYLLKVYNLDDTAVPLYDVCLTAVPREGVTDTDGDGIPDAEDNCPSDYNPGQEENEPDGQGDVCDGDEDNDGQPDNADNRPLIHNPDQANTDSDAQGHARDLDDDTDGVVNAEDKSAKYLNCRQNDNGPDGLGDVRDGDNDGVSKVEVDCRVTSDQALSGADQVGAGNVCEMSPEFCRALFPNRGESGPGKRWLRTRSFCVTSRLLLRNRGLIPETCATEDCTSDETGDMK